MMISLYSGTPGSGKSLHAAKEIYYRLKNDRPTVTNFEINLSAIRKDTSRIRNWHLIDNTDFTPEALMRISAAWFANHKRKEGAILLVVDECQLLFNCRDFNDKSRKSWIKFFSQHRKYGYNIILVAQYDRMIDRQIRAQVEYEYQHRRFSNFGIVGKLVKLFTFGDVFAYVKYYYAGTSRPEKVSMHVYKAHKKYYSLYDTYLTFDDLTSDDNSLKRYTCGSDTGVLPNIEQVPAAAAPAPRVRVPLGAARRGAHSR